MNSPILAQQQAPTMVLPRVTEAPYVPRHSWEDIAEMRARLCEHADVLLYPPPAVAS